MDAARLALVEEKARIAKQLEQQGERLQQEVSIAVHAMRRCHMQEMSGELKLGQGRQTASIWDHLGG